MSHHGDKIDFYPSKARYSLVLTSWYAHFNLKYYKGKLPALKVYWYTGFKKSGIHGATTFENGAPDRILVNRNLKVDHLGRICVMTALLHEMAHVATPDAQHGKVFKDEQKRLVLKGAYDGLL